MIAIAHCDKNWGIGRGNSLMFRLKKDMQFFRAVTLGKVVVMGSKTLRSLPQGKPLSGRTNIVLSKSITALEGQNGGFKAICSVDELLKEIKKYQPDDVFVIGGSAVYSALLPYCSAAYITKVAACGDADCFLENLDRSGSWELVESSLPQDDEGYQISFCKYINKYIKESQT